MNGINSPQKSYRELQQECAPISYKEIEMFFARGMLVLVSNDQDIIKIAQLLQNDDTCALQGLISQEKVIRGHDDHAKKWNRNNTQLMAVTAVPWLLVQEIIIQ